MFRKALSLIIVAALLPLSSLRAEQALVLPRVGTMVALSAPFTPASLKGLVIYPNDPFKFDFIISHGDEVLPNAQKQESYTNLIKYFLAALAVADDQQWVNLSPYEKDRIIPETFGQTQMGNDLLAQDYILKQLSASLLYPEGEIGKKFWAQVYAQAADKNVNVPINTFNKVWIVPDRAVVYEKGNAVYVVENHLKVMTEQDYLASQKNETAAQDPTINAFKDIVLPQIEKEINEGKNFTSLRQVYSGMLLATWYKRTLQDSILSRAYANQGKVAGVNIDPKNNQLIYEQYLQAFKKGVFNMIKESDMLGVSGPRKYFSGGTKGYDQAQIAKTNQIGNIGQADIVTTRLSSPSVVDPSRRRFLNVMGAFALAPVINNVSMPVDMLNSASTKTVSEGVAASIDTQMMTGKVYQIPGLIDDVAEFYVTNARSLSGGNAVLDIVWLHQPGNPKTQMTVNLADFLASVEEVEGFGFTAYTQEIAVEEAVEASEVRSVFGLRMRARLGLALNALRKKLSDQNLELLVEPTISKDAAMLGFLFAFHRGQGPTLLEGVHQGSLSGMTLSEVVDSESLQYLAEQGFSRESIQLLITDPDRTEGMSFGLYKSFRPEHLNAQLRQVNTIDRVLERFLKARALTDKTVSILQIGLGADGFIETNDIISAFKDALDRLGISKEDQPSWELKLKAVDFDKKIIKSFLRRFKKSTPFKLTLQTAEVDALIKSDIDRLVGSDEIDIVFNRNVHYGNYHAAYGGLDLNKARNDDTILSSILGVYIAVRNIMQGLKQGSYFVIEPVEGMVNLQIPGAVMHGDGVYMVDDPQAISKANLEGFLKMQQKNNNFPKIPEGKVFYPGDPDIPELFSKGGIDMNGSSLDLQIKRDGRGMVLPVGRQDLDKLHINGLVPVILDIKPADPAAIFA